MSVSLAFRRWTQADPWSLLARLRVSWERPCLKNTKVEKYLLKAQKLSTDFHCTCTHLYTLELAYTCVTEHLKICTHIHMLPPKCEETWRIWRTRQVHGCTVLTCDLFDRSQTLLLLFAYASPTWHLCVRISRHNTVYESLTYLGWEEVPVAKMSILHKHKDLSLIQTPR